MYYHYYCKIIIKNISNPTGHRTITKVHFVFVFICTILLKTYSIKLSVTRLVLLCMRCSITRLCCLWLYPADYFLVWKRHSSWVLGWKPYQNIIIIQTDCVIICIILFFFFFWGLWFYGGGKEEREG